MRSPTAEKGPQMHPLPMSPALMLLGVCLAPVPRRCACYSDDAYECWALRYGLHDRSAVEYDGGPCQCSCHDTHNDD